MEDDLVGAGTRGGGVAGVLPEILPTEADPEDSPLLAPVSPPYFELVMSLRNTSVHDNNNNNDDDYHNDNNKLMMNITITITITIITITIIIIIVMTIIIIIIIIILPFYIS